MAVEPMLLTEVEDMNLINDTTKIFQEKHNGTRAIISVKGGKIVGIRGRSNNPVLFCYPELKDATFDFDTAILDAEICVFQNGKSVFYKGIDQRRSTPDGAKLRNFPVVAVIFDILQLEKEALINKPYKDRLAVMEKVIKNSDRIKLVESTHDGKALWDKVITDNREGVVVKDPNAIYELGKRSKAYLKLKNYKYVDVIVEKTELNEKGTKIYSNIVIDGTPIQVECQQAGMFNVHVGDNIRVKYLDIVGDRLIQPTRY